MLVKGHEGSTCFLEVRRELIPLEVRLPLGGGRWGRARFKDRGSLAAAVDRLWREDAYAVVQPANETWGAEAWIPVVGGDAVAVDSPLAAEAAEALRLDLCAVRVRGRGGEGRVAEVVGSRAADYTVSGGVRGHVASVFLVGWRYENDRANRRDELGVVQ